MMKRSEATMGEGNGMSGHGNANDAYKELEDMIQFAKPMAGEGAESETRLKIKMSEMGMNLGDTLSQLNESMSKGQGSQQGGMGKGGGGQAGSQTEFAMYGAESFSDEATKESSSGPRKMTNAKFDKGEPDPLAGSVEEIVSEDGDPDDFFSEGADRFIEEYHGLIEAYFKSIAEEKSSK